jgi:hypothetical protein
LGFGHDRPGRLVGPLVRTSVIAAAAVAHAGAWNDIQGERMLGRLEWLPWRPSHRVGHFVRSEGMWDATCTGDSGQRAHAAEADVTRPRRHQGCFKRNARPGGGNGQYLARGVALSGRSRPGIVAWRRADRCPVRWLVMDWGIEACRQLTDGSHCIMGRRRTSDAGWVF